MHELLRITMMLKIGVDIYGIQTMTKTDIKVLNYCTV